MSIERKRSRRSRGGTTRRAPLLGVLAGLVVCAALARPSIARAMPSAGERFFPALPHRAYQAAPAPRGSKRVRVAERGAPSTRAASRRRANGPTIAAVLAAAYTAAGLDRDHARSDARRARLAGLVPWLTARAARATSWEDGAVDIGHSTTLELRATWRLDRLVFDSHELQLQNMEAARRRQRRALASQVIRAYFAWRRAAAAVAASGGGLDTSSDDTASARDGRDGAGRRGSREALADDLEDDVDNPALPFGSAASPGEAGLVDAARGGDGADPARGGALAVMTRLDETIAELDALTEGWFADELQRARRRGHEVPR